MEPVKIHIFGASGSGTTTLARALATEIKSEVFDADDYYWYLTNPPYQQKRTKSERAELLKAELMKRKSFVLSGCISGWGEWIKPILSHSIMMSLDNEVRMERLAERERLEYGDRTKPGGDMFQIHNEFMEWAATYETASPPTRSRALHRQWLAQQSCQTITLDSAHPVEDLVNQVKTLLEAKA